MSSASLCRSVAACFRISVGVCRVHLNMVLFLYCNLDSGNRASYSHYYSASGSVNLGQLWKRDGCWVFLFLLTGGSLNSWTPALLAGGLISPRVMGYDLTGLQEQIGIWEVLNIIFDYAGRAIISHDETELVTDFYLFFDVHHSVTDYRKRKNVGWGLDSIYRLLIWTFRCVCCTEKWRQIKMSWQR